MGLNSSSYSFWDTKWLGKKNRSVTVPVLDGPFKPNQILDEIETIIKIVKPNNLKVFNNEILLTSQKTLFQLTKEGVLQERLKCDNEISALAVSKAGKIAIGLVDEGIYLLGEDENLEKINLTQNCKCVTDLLFLNDGSLIVTNGSENYNSDEWLEDLMRHGASGKVLKISPDLKKTTILAQDLSFPSGICILKNKHASLAVSECWKHRIIEIDQNLKRKPKVLIDNLPSYPARILSMAEKGYLLTNYSTRSQLIEFVLSEKHYLDRMLKEVPRPYWIGPSLKKKESFLEPLQAGGVIRLGIHKPWSPSLSYGLVIFLNSQFKPTFSAHSRANGNRHGIISAAEINDDLYIASISSGEIVKWHNQNQS